MPVLVKEHLGNIYKYTHTHTHTHIYACVPTCPTLCDSMGCSPSDSSVHGILQARILEWVAMPSSKGSCWPRDQTCISPISPALVGGFFTTSTNLEDLPPNICIFIYKIFIFYEYIHTNLYVAISLSFSVWLDQPNYYFMYFQITVIVE